MRIQHYEYDVDGETRRLLVLSETGVDLSNGFDEEWRKRTGFHGIFATRERVQLGEYFEPDIDPVSKLAEEVAAGTITADDIAATPGEKFVVEEPLAETDLQPFVEAIERHVAQLAAAARLGGYPWRTPEQRALLKMAQAGMRVDPELKYKTAQPTITREQAGKAYHDAQGDPCYGWDQHGKETRDHFIAKGVHMLELLSIDVAKDGD